MTRRGSQNPQIVAGIAALRDLVPDGIYEELLRAAALVRTELDEVALLGTLAEIRNTQLVHNAALGKKPQGNRQQRRAALRKQRQG